MSANTKPKLVMFGSEVWGVELTGDPKKQPEKPHFRVAFPGGDIDIARTTDGEYWVHVNVNRVENGGYEPESDTGRITDARLDIHGKSTTEADLGDFGHEGLFHIAFKIEVDKES